MICVELCEDTGEAPGERGHDLTVSVRWHGPIESGYPVVYGSFSEVPCIFGLGCVS